MSRNVVLLVMLALCACSEPPEAPPPGDTDAGCDACGAPDSGVPDAGGSIPKECWRHASDQFRLLAEGETVFTIGQPAELAFTWSTHRNCPWPMEARLEGPGGAPFEPTLVLEPPTGTEYWSIRGAVRFTPTEAGTWRVTLRVGPQVDEVMGKVLVAVDRSGAPVQELPRWCQALHRTARGTLLCDGEVYRGTERVQTLAVESLLATAGNVVWEVDGTRVRRHEDTGTGGLTPAPALALDTGRTEALLLHATEQELLVVHDGGHLARYVYTEGMGLAASGEATYPYSPYLPTPGNFQLRRFDDRVMLVAAYGDMSAACYYRAAGSELTLVTWVGPTGAQWNKCQSLTGAAIGLGEAGLWTLDGPPPEELRLYELRDGTLEQTAHWWVPAPMNVRASDPLSVTTNARVRHYANTRLQWFVPARGPHGVVVERFESSDGFELRAVHGDLAYEISTQAPPRTRVFTR